MSKTPQEETINKMLRDIAKKGNAENLELCIQKGGNIHLTFNMISYERYREIEAPAFFFSIKDDFKKDFADIFLKYGADINTQDEYGQTALVWAIKLKNIDIVKYLLENGININAQDNEGDTALTIAIRHNHTDEIVKHLLENGADPLIKNNDNETSLDTYYNLYQQYGSSLKEDVGIMILKAMPDKIAPIQKIFIFNKAAKSSENIPLRAPLKPRPKKNRPTSPK